MEIREKIKKILQNYHYTDLSTDEAIDQILILFGVSVEMKQSRPLPPSECIQCGVLIDHRLNYCGDCRIKD